MKRKINRLELDIDSESFKLASTEDKKRHIRGTIKRLLDRNPSGLTISQITELTGFNPKTVSKHLDYLTAMREAYKVDMGSHVAFFFPNGKLIHEARNRFMQVGDHYYTFQLIKNIFGSYIYVQENTKDEYNTFTVKGGLIVQKEGINHFMEILRNFVEEIEEVEENGGSQTF